MDTDLMQVPDRSGYESNLDLLRFTTAGSVDDGKSTLIGRLLYDTRSTFEDQLHEVEQASRRRGDEGMNLALLTDGLRAEREQGITIDVAYRYFATPRRKFIIADTPGHVQYTRNMVTGASSADLAVVLIDARQGVVSQSRRHGFIASLLRIGHVVVAVNKMDAVDYRKEAFDAIVTDYRTFSDGIEAPELTFIPISALFGDNVVRRSEHTPWYTGPTLLDHLETISVTSTGTDGAFRFPVQYVVRPDQDYRGYAGRVASGWIRPGDAVTVLPSGVQTRVASIVTFEGERAEAGPLDSVTLTLEDEVDVCRGDLIVHGEALPHVGHTFRTIVCWTNDQPLDLHRTYLLRYGSATANIQVERVEHRVNVDTLLREQTETIGLNDIASLILHTARPVVFDSYRDNRLTGSFILVDPSTNDTVAAGMIDAVVDTQHGAGKQALRAYTREGMIVLVADDGAAVNLPDAGPFEESLLPLDAETLATLARRFL